MRISLPKAVALAAASIALPSAAFADQTRDEGATLTIVCTAEPDESFDCSPVTECTIVDGGAAVRLVVCEAAPEGGDMVYAPEGGGPWTPNAG